LVREALKLLLERSDMAVKVGDIDSLLQCKLPGIEAFVAAIDFFAADPTFTVAQMIESWRGTPEGALIEALAAERNALDGAAVEREFEDACTKLHQRSARNRFQELLELAQKGAISAPEQAELKELSRQLHHGRLV
jgi:DNA primase